MLKDISGLITPTHAQVISPVPTTKPTPVKEDHTNYSMHVDQGYTDEKPERYEIEAYIREVFGDYSSTAFRLLKCENSDWKVDMVNTYGNTPDNARDMGLFSINEYWQGVNGKFLLNWRLNTLAAKQLFDENNHSFKMWTCGQTLGI